MDVGWLDLGGVPTELAIDGGQLAAAVGAHYAAFSTGTAPTLRVALQARGDRGDPDPGPVEVGSLPGGRYLARRGDFQVEIDPVAGAAAGDLRGGVASVDSCLRVLLSIYLAPRRGLLLHAAGVAAAGLVHVFYGPSGAGKTTVARLSAGHTILSDELMAVHAGEGGGLYLPHPRLRHPLSAEAERGAGGEVRPTPRALGQIWAAGTPFWGELEGAGQPVCGPVAGLYRLVQSPAIAVGRLATGAALLSLMPCVLFFARDPALVEAVTETCLAIAASGHCHELRFRRDATFWASMASDVPA